MNDRYTPLGRVGRGGQGEVILARDEKQDRKVAIKIREVRSEAERASVVAEAQILLGLSPHAGVPTVRDDFFVGDRYHLVMDWVEGRSLARLLTEEGAPGLAFDRVQRWITQVAEALDHLHGHGPPIVHGDVKPHNIVVTADDRAVLVDFAMSHTRAHRPYGGTPAYIAPELLAGSDATPAADIFALAVTTYELLTGRRPEPGEQPDLSSVPVELQQVVLDALGRGLSLDPGGRPATAGRFAAALAQPDDRGRVPLVGRDREIAEVERALADAMRGAGRLVVLSGGAGIGKTRLLSEIADVARRGGARTFWGRCWEGQSLQVYTPWVQILHAATETIDADRLAARLGHDVTFIAELLPHRFARSEHPRFAPPAFARSRLFDAVRSLVAELCADGPIVLLIDDLHLADRPTIDLLQNVATEIERHPLLVVAAHREQLALLDRPEDVRIELGGLKTSAISQLVRRSFDLDLGPREVNDLVDITSGNPFFLNEVVRLKAAERRYGRPFSRPPEGVKEAVRRRLGFLSADARLALEAAAVCGRSFEERVLSSAVEPIERRSADVLGEAEAHRVVQREGRSWRFAHDLFRETIYDDLALDRRSTLHGRIGDAIERIHHRDIDEHIAQLAHHFSNTDDTAYLSKAAAYARRAAEQAMRRFAYEEAAELFTQAMHAAESVREPDVRLLAALANRTGDAYRFQGKHDIAKDEFRRAADLARRSGSPDELALAAVWFIGGTIAAGVVDTEHVGMLREALDALPDDHQLRGTVMSALAVALYFTDASEERDRLSAEGLRLAHLTGDATTIAMALSARHVALWNPDSLDERRHVADVFVEHAQRMGGDLEMLLQALTWRITDAFEVGDIAAVDADIERHRDIATRTKHLNHLWFSAHWDASRALIDGRFAEAEPLIEEAFKIGLRSGDPNASAAYAGQTAVLRREQGRLEEVAPAMNVFAVQFPTIALWRCALLAHHAEAGEHDTAVVELEALASNGFSSIGRDSLWLPSMMFLAEACSELGAVEHARQLYALVAPYAERCAVVGPGTAFLGSMQRALALLAETAGARDDADTHFRAAIEVHRRMGARPWVDRTEREHGRMRATSAAVSRRRG